MARWSGKCNRKRVNPLSYSHFKSASLRIWNQFWKPFHYRLNPPLLPAKQRTFPSLPVVEIPPSGARAWYHEIA